MKLLKKQKLFQQKVLQQKLYSNKKCFDKFLHFTIFLLVTMALVIAISFYLLPQIFIILMMIPANLKKLILQLYYKNGK